MTDFITVCSGQGCEMAVHCENYRYCPDRPGQIVMTATPARPGEACPDLQLREKAWGEGAE
jgi:hypothetical protein